MRTIWRGATLVAALALIGTQAAAQHAPRGWSEVRSDRAGFWLALGLGAGGETFDLRDGLGYSDPLYRPTISLRLGGTVDPSLRLGGEILAWVDDHGSSTESLTSVLFVGQLYPSHRAGLYLKGGLGIGRNAIEFDDGFDAGDTGFAALVGAGYEIRLGRRVFLTPAIDFVQHWYNERGAPGYRERLVNFGVGIGFQTGR